MFLVNHSFHFGMEKLWFFWQNRHFTDWADFFRRKQYFVFAQDPQFPLKESVWERTFSSKIHPDVLLRNTTETRFFRKDPNVRQFATGHNFFQLPFFRDERLAEEVFIIPILIRFSLQYLIVQQWSSCLRASLKLIYDTFSTWFLGNLNKFGKDRPTAEIRDLHFLRESHLTRELAFDFMRDMF